MIGRYVTIGQGCVLRSTTIGDEVVVGDKCAFHPQHASKPL